MLFHNPNNIVYPNTTAVELNAKKKPTDTWMQDYTLDQRKLKFFEFCDKFDMREDDLLKDDFQIFSHRLHWHEHPYAYICCPGRRRARQDFLEFSGAPFGGATRRD